MGALVGPGQLATYLQRPIRRDSEELAIRVAEGWLRTACSGLADWPSPVPDDLWSWAIELAAMVYSNPEGLATRTVNEDTHGWILSRRAEILKAARESRYGGRTPAGDFPLGLDWPDPPRVPCSVVGYE